MRMQYGVNTTKMSTEIMKSFGALQAELEKAKDSLKGVDEHIKKLIGRDPAEPPLRPGVKRPSGQQEEFRGRGRGFALNRGRRDLGARPEEDESPVVKKRPGDPRTVFSRLSGPPRGKRGDSPDDDELPNKPLISSRVIATPKELPSRQEAMAAQNTDELSKARNKRMFGALLGTLQKFRQEETRMRDKEEKRAKVEKKLEENAKREKEELKKERQELFLERKRKQAEIRKIELKMLRMKEQDEWENKNRHLLNFIQTKAKPHIFYLPSTHNTKTEERLIASQKVVAKMIEKKREEVRLELEAIEKRGRWRQGLGEQEGGLAQEGSDDEQMDSLEVGDKENRLQSVGGEMNVSIIESVVKVPGSGKEGETYHKNKDNEKVGSRDSKSKKADVQYKKEVGREEREESMDAESEHDQDDQDDQDDEELNEISGEVEEGEVEVRTVIKREKSVEENSTTNE